ISTGAVAIDGVEIVAVGPRVELLERFPNANVEDFGEAAILPGFVNCHSHLEITGMRGSLDAVEHDFGAWLLKLNALRGAMSEDDIKAAAIAGAREGAAAGVTCFGDIGRFGFAGLYALKTVGLRGVLYQETEFSADDRTADDAFEQLKDKFLGLREQQTELVEAGLSPHSPYTVSRKLFEKIARFAIDETVKVSIHAAESTDEENLVRKGNGFFRSLMDRFEVEWQSPRCSSVEYLLQTGILETKPLLAHCVTVSDTDIELIASSGTSVAHCPKSNAKFGHGYAPFEKFLDARIAVGLGSDSVASNNVCDLLEESRFAAFSARNRHGRSRFVTAREVLTAITLGGARAMRLDDSIGSLEAGKQADITVVSLAHLAQQPVTDVEAGLVFSSNARDILMTMVAGTAVHRSGIN
ncbi:MAG TPA: amidohydrolase family protein, partial [Pyrinomonadaceae bacterium]|nr:amidohydrolase family protein [Pyrinomonadaceae bacterium]